MLGLIGPISTVMKQSGHDPAHSVPLKIRLPQSVRQQLAADSAGKPLSRFIVERLRADVFPSPVLAHEIGVLYEAALETLLRQERRLALHYRDFHAVTRVLLRVAVMLAQTSAFLRRPRSRSIDERYLEGAREKIQTAIAILENLPEVVADNTATDPEADTKAIPSSLSASIRLGRRRRPASARQSEQGEDIADSDDPGGLGGLPDAGDLEQQPPCNLVEVKIRLPETLRRQLEAAATYNNRTLTAEIRGRLESSCALGMLKKRFFYLVDKTLALAEAEALELLRKRYALSTGGFYAVIDALWTAQAILSPSSGFVRRVRPQSAARLELEDARRRIRAALAVLERLPEAKTEPALETIATDTDTATAPEVSSLPSAAVRTIKLRSPRS
jgi:hypothetical protein